MYTRTLLDRSFPEPEWTQENINKKRGETTFSICGWCEHAGGGCYHYDCALETTCNLLATHAFNNLKNLWNTPCIIRQLGFTDIDEIIAKKMRDVEVYQKQILNTNAEIAALYDMRRNLSPTPVIAPHRSAEHFNVDDDVMVFDISDISDISDTMWHPARVVMGYRHHDGVVSYTGDFAPGGEVYGCGCLSPTILLASEFEFFAQHPELFQWWLEFSIRGTRFVALQNEILDAFQHQLRQRTDVDE